MRGAALGLLALACAAGCLGRNARPTVQQIVRSLAPPLPAEGLLVESVLIEQPAGDRFLDRTLWDTVQPLGQPETRALLAENGLRAGVITGTGPQKFQTLLDSDADTVSPQRMTFHLRKEAVVPTAGPVDPCKFSLRTDLAGKPAAREFKRAQCGVLVRPELAPDGRVRVWCEPQLQHGERRQWLRPNEDGTRFEKREEVPVEKYAVLGVEAVLGPDDYLLVGCDAAARDTLGVTMFSADADGRPRQRVLVVRARSATPVPPADLPPITSPLKRPAVATQAAGRK
jgi:hypothetical protein